MPVDDPGLGIYVHWPFCLAKCPYCDFNSHVRDRIDQDRWRSAYLAELKHYATLTPGRQVTSIFFGGGTPSLMDPATTAAVIDAISRHWDISDDVEITLEANPTSVEAGRFEGFRSAGVNRVSLGVQALNDADLRFLGRHHSAAEAIAAVDLAARHFPRWTFDLIYARPGQSLESWAEELNQALPLVGSHLSVYQLTIEPGTPFQAMVRRGDLQCLDEDLQVDLFDLTQAMLLEAGLPAYEISNHARPGAESRHNCTYWQYGDYVGIGPGAHGRLTVDVGGGDGRKVATRGHRAPEIWLDRVARTGHGGHPHEDLDADARFVEMVMMGLRLRDGISRPRLVAETARDIPDIVSKDTLSMLVDEGLLSVTTDRVVATAEGRKRLNSLLGAMLA